MACHGTCYQVEYRASKKKILSSTPNPDNKTCNTAANKAFAEKEAEKQLDTEMENKKEDKNQCAEETGCTCPAWPEWVGGWAITLARITSVQTVPVGSGCSWKVMIEYDREERSRSAHCK
jgi:hypothetical protein